MKKSKQEEEVKEEEEEDLRSIHLSEPAVDRSRGYCTL